MHQRSESMIYLLFVCVVWKKDIYSAFDSQKNNPYLVVSVKLNQSCFWEQPEAQLARPSCFLYVITQLVISSYLSSILFYH